jgi:16S rRNA (guanine527-N7)-methyltransferase
MLKKLLINENIILDDKKIELLENFSSLLHQWNKIHNLTGARTLDAIYKNIIDSLYPMTFIKEPKNILDVGTGAGFPGFILAIIFDKAEVVLCEPLKKRVSFLKYTAISLGLDNIKVEAVRVESLRDYKFELISSRAVTNTDMLLNLTKEVSSDSTHYLFYKGNRVFDEIEDVKNQLDYDIVQKNRRNYLYIKSNK